MGVSIGVISNEEFMRRFACGELEIVQPVWPLGRLIRQEFCWETLQRGWLRLWEEFG